MNDLKNFLAEISIPDFRLRDYYKYIYIFTTLLNRFDIQYSIMGGSALGAVRHGAFIPWDDDFDVVIEECFEHRLLECKSQFEKYGIYLNKESGDGFYQFYIKNNRLNSTSNHYYPFDFFVLTRCREASGVILRHKSPIYREWYPKYGIPLDLFYPLSKIKFGPLLLSVMHNVNAHLENEGLSLNEAIIKIHMTDQNYVDEMLALFKEKNLYPITDMNLLRVSDISDFTLDDIDFYLI
jgi:phosphorylcholine metabolism protein LicD